MVTTMIAASILKWTLSTIKFLLFGAGGVVVFVGKNIALGAAALFFHHQSLADAAYAVSPFLAMLLGDALWYMALSFIKKRMPSINVWVAGLVPYWGLRLVHAH